MTKHPRGCARPLKSTPTTVWAYFNLGVLSKETGHPQEAAGYYQKAVAINPE